MSVGNLMKKKSITTGRPSPSIWGDCPINELKNYPDKGLYFFDDFHAIQMPTTAESNGPWYPIIGSSCTITQAKDNNGVVAMTQHTSDNGVISLSTGNNTSGITKITSKMSTKWWFEARFKIATVTNDDVALFIGLAEEGLSAQAGIIADTTSDIADKDVLGFYVDDGDGDDLTIVHRKEGVAVVSKAGKIALAADTWVQVGMKFEPQRNEIDVFMNGVKVHTIDPSHASFPSGEDLAIYLVNKGMNGVQATDIMSVDFVGLAHANY